MRRTSDAVVLLLAVLCAASAGASGFYFVDNGNKTVMQGGAITAEADDLSAMQHNPAGLSQKRGFSFLADGNLLFHSVSFLRQFPNFDPGNPNTKASNVVEADKAPYLSPMLAVGYGFPVGARTLAIAAGIWGPPAVGKVSFPSPNYAKEADGKYVSDPRRFAGHRYGLIAQDILIAYPTLSVSLDVHPKVLVGLSAQLVLSNFVFSQALYSGLSTPTRFTEEDPYFDSIGHISLPGVVGVTGILGVLVKPIEQLAFGISVRPPIPVKARGDFTIDLGEFARSVGTEVRGKLAELNFTMPLELRVGARVVPHKRLGINFDFIFQGWSSVDAMRLTPKGVTRVVVGQETDVPAFSIEKRWRDTVSLRLGAAFEVVKYLSVHAGGWWESQAAPTEYFNIDFAHPSRFFLSGGVTGHFGPIDASVGLAWTPIQTLAITQSELRQGQTESAVQGGVIGTGIYTTGGVALSFGVRGHFEPEPKKDEKKKEEKPKDEPKAAPEKPQAPAPVEAPPAEAPAAPAPTPAP